MSVLNQIAFYQNRRDEVPNQELAKQLVETQNQAGVREIAENLWNDNPNVRADCLKVLYEIGYLDPQLIAGYMQDFLKLLRDKNNRLVWGSMIALSTIAEIKAEELFPRHAEIQKAMGKGSVITIDNGVKTLAMIASAETEFQEELFPYLLAHLATCRPKDVPQHAEKVLAAVNADNKGEFVQVLEKRMSHLTDSQAKRARRVIKAAAAR